MAVFLLGCARFRRKVCRVYPRIRVLIRGLGGIRIGFESAFREKGFDPVCVFSSEIKEYAIKAYKNYFNDEEVAGDITQISAADIKYFDFLLAGFPCQPFSAERKGL